MAYKSLQETVDEMVCNSVEIDDYSSDLNNQLHVDFKGELSGYSTYTPIRMSSRTVALNADMERNNNRNRRT